MSFKKNRAQRKIKNLNKSISKEKSLQDKRADNSIFNMNFDCGVMPQSFSTHTFHKPFRNDSDPCNYKKSVQLGHPMPIKVEGVNVSGAMDSAFSSLNSIYGFKETVMNPALASYYSSQGFIGYQMLSIMMQDRFINKACEIPAQDAVRKGYEITVNDGSGVDSDIIDEIYELNDRKYHLNENMIEYVKFGRGLGVRHALFMFDDPEWDYSLPFNADNIKPDTYQGICQIDPIWISPQLDQSASANPADLNYYEPTWWKISGLDSMLVHRSQFVIMRNSDLPDLLKPTYQYGGLSVTQQIYERVYAAERIANEAPQLALTKRIITLKTDTSNAEADPRKFQEVMEMNAAFQTNYAWRVVGSDDEVSTSDTSLADLDSAIMTQYQLVSSIAGIPATKLLGTQPKGFNSTGEYEESTYHESLQSIQANFLHALIDRHHECVFKSDIQHKYNIQDMHLETVFTPLDALTEKEQAEINLLKAQTSSQLYQTGAISSEDDRNRIIEDKTSGYNGMLKDDYEDDDDEQTRKILQDDVEGFKIVEENAKDI